MSAGGAAGPCTGHRAKLPAMSSQGGEASAETYRETCLLLAGVIERQQRAIDLQLLAARELSEAAKEQSRIISTLLVGDPSAALSLPLPQTGEDSR